MELSSLRTLGHSGLPVTPLALGTMTFGNKAWGSSDDTSQAIFNAYIDAGGNFIDTADVYAGGRSEELVGAYLAERKLRDRVVLATKFSFSGGNGRKNLHRALEGSLRRLGTNHVDLYWMHVWDMVTPVEEMLQSLGDLVRAGKIRYFGLSDMPAWYMARMATLAQAYNVPGPIAMQMSYSLADRWVEYEHLSAAQQLGIGLAAWSPLRFGFLSGKYSRTPEGLAKTAGGSRLDANVPMFQRFTERNWKTLDVLREVSEAAGESMATIALAWLVNRAGVSSTILGANTVDQLHANVRCLEVTLAPEHLVRLEEASALDPSPFFTGDLQSGIFGGKRVTGWSTENLL